MRCGTGISDARPPVIVIVGRRKPAHQPRHFIGKQPCWVALHPRRTEHRTALTRHRTANPRVAPPAAAGKHGGRCGARRGNHACRRLDYRHRTFGWTRRRQCGVSRACRQARQSHRQSDGKISNRRDANTSAQAAPAHSQLHRDYRCGAKQHQGHRRALPAAGDDRGDRRERLWKVDSRARHPLQRAAAPLRRGLREHRVIHRSARRPVAHQQRGICRPEPHREIFAQQCGDLS